MGLIVTQVIIYILGLFLEIAVWLLASLTCSGLASWAVYCGSGVSLPGRLLQVVGQSSTLLSGLAIVWSGHCPFVFQSVKGQWF